MSGGGGNSGGGGTTVVQPSTTTTVQDIPAWEQGYVQNLLGQAQTIAGQPYQQFPGQQIAGFTPDQMQAFQNVEGSGAPNLAAQGNAANAAGAGANTANNIYGAGSPLLNASTMAASPLGIQQYMSPYMGNVVQGMENEANQNWNQNIMPGINNEFTHNGMSGSGRNAQVLGQAAGNFQTGLSANIANTLNQGYTTAGNQAATEAGILGQAGASLGNLAATQSGAQQSAGTTLGNLGAQAATTNLNQNQALQGVGQQQQQLEQTNLNTAQQNWQNQVNWPATQTEYLNQIIRGLPAPSASTSASQSPAYSVSPLTGVGGSLAGVAGLLGNGHKEGGLIKGYAEGGSVDDPSDSAPNDANPLATAVPKMAPVNPLADMPTPPPAGMSASQLQNMQLLALSRGLLTPTMGGSGMAALGQGIGNIEDVTMAGMGMQQKQQQLNFENKMKEIATKQEQEKIEQGRYSVFKDAYGNGIGMVDTKSGKITPLSMPNQTTGDVADEAPSADPQKAALQIMKEQGTVPTQAVTRQDITGRNKQVESYNNQALAAKNVVQQLDTLNAQTGKYSAGKGMGNVYGAESWLGVGGEGATARTEADKAATQLANAFMQANTAANRSGIGVLNFDAKGVPNPDMPDQARNDLIAKQKAIANSQIQRAEISNMYPRMQISNVNTIMNAYEAKNPPLLPSGDANPNWMPYHDWLKAGRPDTATSAGKSAAQPSSGGKIATQADIDETAKSSGKSADAVKKALIAKGYTIQ